MTPWRDDQIRRYSRHVLLTEVGGVGQRRILAARVALALGAPAAEVAFEYLVGAGVGTIAVAGLDDAGLAERALYAREHNPDVTVERARDGEPLLPVSLAAMSLADAHGVGGAAAAAFLTSVIGARA